MTKNRSFEILLLIAALCGLVSLSQAQTQPSVQQSASGPAASEWIYQDSLREAPRVSIGDEGGQVFAHFPAPCCGTRSAATLFSAYQSTGAPIWTGMTRFDRPGAVDSASGADVHVSATRQAAEVSNPGPVRVWCWRSSSNTADWVYTHPTPSSKDPDVRISRDGSLVVAAIATPDASGAWDVVALDGVTGSVCTQTTVVPASPASVFQPLAFALAGDAGDAALIVGTEVFLVDVDAGTVVLHLDGLPQTQGGIGMSADGNVLAWANSWIGEIHVLERSGGTWQPVFVWTGGSDSGFVQAAVSEDGSTVAAAFGGFPFPGNAILSVALDVPTRSQAMYDVKSICCDIGYRPSDLAITPDGARFVVGVRGGLDLEAADRVLLYARDQDDPLATWISDASDIGDVALSPDGCLVAAGSSDPFEPPGSVTGAWLNTWRYDPLGSDFRVVGAPQVGGVFDFVLTGSPGQDGFLLLSLAPAWPPLPLPESGTLYLDPAGLQLKPVGLVQANGWARLTVLLPPDPLLVGVAVWTQGLLTPDLTLSADWHKLTLLP